MGSSLICKSSSAVTDDGIWLMVLSEVDTGD